MKHTLFKIGLAALALNPWTAWAQSPGHPMAVPIKMWATGTQTGTSPLLEIQLSGAIPSTDFPGGIAEVSQSTFSGTGTTPVATIQLVPNQVYSVTLTATNAAGYYYFAPPNGYTLLVNGVPERCFGPITAYNTTINESEDLQLLRIDTPSAKAGVSSQIESGMVSWQVSLGGLLNGNSAGYLSICDTGLEATWSTLYTPGALQYMAPSPEVVTHVNTSTGYLQQILADQADVDIEVVNSTTYTISFYNPAQLSGTGFPYSFSGLPFVQYTVSQASGGGESIQIQSVTYETTSSNYTSVPAARTALTTLTRTGTAMPAYTWNLNNWNTSGETQIANETRTWAGTTSARTENLVVSGSAGLATTINKGFTLNNWGEELTSTSVGTLNSVTHAFSYYSGSNSANPGTYGFLASASSSDGSWAAYNYYTSSSPTNLLGTLTEVYRPFNNAPSSPSWSGSSGEVTSLTWVDDPYGAPTRPSTSMTQVNGVTTASSSTTYTDQYTSVSIDLPLGNPPSSWTANTDYVTQAVSTEYSDTSHTLVATNLFFAENTIDPLVACQTYSTTGPDGVQQSYAYQRGTFNPSTYAFTAGDTGSSAPASSIAVITGSSNSSAGSSYSSYNGFPINLIYLVNAKSTMQVTIRDPLGLVRSVQSYVWLSGWQLIGSTDYAYDFAGNLVQTVALNGGVTTAVFAGEQAASTTDATGITLDYSYDYAGRVSAVAKVGGSTTNLTYDSAGRTVTRLISGTGTTETIPTSYAFDDAGRLQTETPPGSSAGVAPIGYTYSYTPTGTSTWARTTKFGDGGTRIDAYQADGRLASVTGTAVAPQYYTYSLDGTYLGFLDTQVAFDTTPKRYTVGVTDWLGRTCSVTKQGFPGAGAFVVQNTYDSGGGTGHLLSTSRTGYANTLYVYDALGNVVESGLDVNSNGTLDPSSSDRITAYNTYVWSGSGGYWLRKDTTTYPTAGSTNTVSTSVLQRLTGFSTSQLQETMALDEYSNNVDQSVTVNTGTQTVTATTTEPGFSNPQVVTTVNGLKTKVTGVDTLITQFGYDPLERPTTVTDSRGNVTTTGYISNSALVATVADQSPATLATYGYDGAGRRDSVTDASGYTTTLTYNTLGLLANQTGSGAYPVSYAYDIYGGLNTMTTTWGAGSGTNATTTWTNDQASGLLATKTDAAGNQTTFTYTAARQVASRAWARPINNVSGNPPVTTSYSYDGATGELLGKTYNDGSTPSVTLTYSRAGQLQTVADAAGSRTFNFDATYGNQVDSESLDSSFYSGRVLTQLYDAASGVSPTDNYNGEYQTATVLGRPTGFELGSSSNPSRDIVQQLVHSNLGQMVGVNATNGTTATRDFVYSYLANSELISGYSPTSASGFAVNCSYDSIRPLLTTIQGSVGSSVVTEFDYTYNGKRQRLSALQRGSAYADYFSGASYTGVYNYYGYDSRGELNTAAMYPGSTVPSGGPGGASTLPARTFQYQFDAIGNRTSAGESGGPDDNAYVPNSVNQYSSVENEVVRVLGNNALGLTASVTGATTTQLDRNYGADFFANNSSPNQAAQGTITVTAGSGNVSNSYFIPPAVQTPTYDNDGNILTDGVWGNSTTDGYSYDGEDRLVGMLCTLPSGSGFTRLQLTFTYDYLGRRVEKKAVNIDTSAVTFDHRYIYSGHNLIAEMDTSGHLIRSYTWGIGGPGTAGSFIELTNFNYNGSWTLLGTSDYFPTSDGNGNVASLVSSAGVTTAVYEYGPFGETLRRETPTSDTTVADNPIRFASNYTDSETGLVYYGQRYYNPTWGRFINKDPIGENGGLNLYGFCGNDGVNGYDVGGMGPASEDPNAGLANLPMWQQNAIRQQMQTDRETPYGSGANPFDAAGLAEYKEDSGDDGGATETNPPPSNSPGFLDGGVDWSQPYPTSPDNNPNDTTGTSGNSGGGGGTQGEYIPGPDGKVYYVTNALDDAPAGSQLVAWGTDYGSFANGTVVLGGSNAGMVGESNGILGTFNSNDAWSAGGTVFLMGYTVAVPGQDHSFTIAVDLSTGDNFIGRGGPLSNNDGLFPSVSLDPWGNILGQTRIWTEDPNQVDNPSATVDVQYIGANNSDASMAQNQMVNYANLVNNTYPTPYWALGTNSNSYNYSQMLYLGLTPPTPVHSVPGWGKNITPGLPGGGN